MPMSSISTRSPSTSPMRNKRTVHLNLEQRSRPQKTNSYHVSMRTLTTTSDGPGPNLQYTDSDDANEQMSTTTSKRTAVLATRQRRTFFRESMCEHIQCVIGNE